jgi:hypothetical protein
MKKNLLFLIVACVPALAQNDPNEIEQLRAEIKVLRENNMRLRQEIANLKAANQVLAKQSSSAKAADPNAISAFVSPLTAGQVGYITAAMDCKVDKILSDELMKVHMRLPRGEKRDWLVAFIGGIDTSQYADDSLVVIDSPLVVVGPCQDKGEYHMLLKPYIVKATAKGRTRR